MKVTLLKFGEIELKDNLKYDSSRLKSLLTRCYFKSHQKLLKYINDNIQKLEICGFCNTYFSEYLFDIKIKTLIVWDYEFINSLEKESKIIEIFNLIKEKYNEIKK